MSRQRKHKNRPTLSDVFTKLLGRGEIEPPNIAGDVNRERLGWTPEQPPKKGKS